MSIKGISLTDDDILKNLAGGYLQSDLLVCLYNIKSVILSFKRPFMYIEGKNSPAEWNYDRGRIPWCITVCPGP